ncbi:MAG TPA: aconitate hydratase, partial [Clostridia bacterium]|nr:aconitate hydratase [Clostridia bacterium]
SVTRSFLESQGRSSDWTPISPDDDALYDDSFDVDLSALEPMVALPHSPDKVVRVRDAGPVPIRQVIIGSCTNSAYEDFKAVASILKGRHVHPDVSLVIAPGSRQVLHAISEDGTLGELIAAGARLLECACGPCIGMGQAPASGSNSLRTFNRNFEGRSGTRNAGVYLCGPQTAAATALHGVLTDPRTLIETVELKLTSSKVDISAPKLIVDDAMLIFPPDEEKARGVEVIKGPNIKPVPVGKPLENEIQGRVLLKVGDDITTDHIMPAGSKILPLRSNIPALSEYCFSACDPEFPKRAKNLKPGEVGFVVAKSNYGQGSSREHAALVPLYLGVRAVFALSFARIHRSNLINAGIMPLVLDEKAYDSLREGDLLLISGARDLLQAALLCEGSSLKRVVIPVKRVSNQDDRGTPDVDVFEATLEATAREIEIIRDGGLLRNIRQVS